MASPQWIGKVKYQTNMTMTIVIGSNTNTHTFILGLAHPSGVGSAVTITTITADGVLTTAQLASALQAAAAASNHEFAKAITWTVNSSTVTATANVAGVPFVLTCTGTGTSTETVTVANVGRNDWNTAGNWSTGSVPVTDDTVTIDGVVSILYGLDQSAVNFTNVYIRGFSGTIGSFGMPLKTGTISVFECDYSGRVFIQPGTTALILIHNTGGGSANADPGLTIGGRSGWTITTIRILGGSLYVYQMDSNLGSVDTVSSLRVEGGSVVVSGAIAVTSWICTGGTSLAQRANGPDALVIDSGTFHNEMLGLTASSVTQNGGYVNLCALLASTVTAYNLRGGTLDCTNSRTALTLTTLTMRQAARAIFDTGVVTATTFTREGVFNYSGLDFGRAN